MGIFDIFTGAPAKEAAGQNSALLRDNQARGTETLNGAQTYSLGALSRAGDMYQPLAQKYGQGTNLYLDSLGVNGAGGNDRATSMRLSRHLTRRAALRLGTALWVGAIRLLPCPIAPATWLTRNTATGRPVSEA
jgi:hypothetical protein